MSTIKMNSFLDSARPNLVVDQQYNLLYASNSFYQFTGDNGSFSLLKLVHKDDLDYLLECVEEAKREKFSRTVVRIKDKQEEYQHIAIFIRRTEDGENYLVEYHNVFKAIEEKVELSFDISKYRNYLFLGAMCFFDYDILNDHFTLQWTLNDEIITIFQGNLSSYKAHVSSNHLVARLDQETFGHFCDDLQGDKDQFEHLLVTSMLSSGEVCEYTKVRGRKVYHVNEEPHMVGVWYQYNEMMESKADRVLETVYQDALTGLLNKAEIIKYAESIINCGSTKHMALIIIDIDDFKEFNDSYGHLFGDEVIKAVASTIRKVVGEAGMAGRIGGDEFLVVINNFKEEWDIRSILRAMKSNIQWLFKDRLENMQINCSFGAAFYPEHTQSYRELFQLADKCLYIAKEKGKNRYVIYDKAKHGPLNTREVSEQMLDLKVRTSAAQNAVQYGEMLANLMIEGKEGIDRLLKESVENLEIDRAVFYTGKDLTCTYVASMNPGYTPPGKYEVLPFYQKDFSEQQIYVLDNIYRLEFSEKELFNFWKSQNIVSIFQYRYFDKAGNVVGLLSFERTKLSRKWPNELVGRLVILCKVLEKLMNSEKSILSNGIKRDIIG